MSTSVNTSVKYQSLAKDSWFIVLISACGLLHKYTVTVEVVCQCAKRSMLAGVSVPPSPVVVGARAGIIGKL